MNNIIFNTICTREWAPLVSVLARSIKEFSQHKLVINCINFNYISTDPQIITRRISANIQSFSDLCRYKWSTMLDQDFDLCVMLDADTIALPDIDEIVNDNKNLSNEDFPLFAPHPHDPFSNPIHSQNLAEMMRIFTNKKPNMKYVYASGLVSKKHINFIKEVVDSIDWFNCRKIPTYIEDEGILNCLLSKYSVSKNLSYNYFPNYTLYQDYLDNNLEHSLELKNTYLDNNCAVKFCSLHGCKNSSLIEEVLQQVITQKKHNATI